ncbi:hypothetical protein KP79_PYT10752 [Mizuhopecten yessoensis]|uniref:Transmembrane protein n=1 Tax=Mizuhopecten yessoensis TaxID=6573 RepID=A0A210PPG2_MIZYE|nr:hypothetical protein KP79_PYT10752 [Mizuhopecten yessoensis]
MIRQTEGPMVRGKGGGYTVLPSRKHTTGIDKLIDDSDRTCERTPIMKLRVVYAIKVDIRGLTTLQFNTERESLGDVKHISVIFRFTENHKKTQGYIMDPKPISCRYVLVSVANAVINLVVVSILAVFFWRGTWEVMDVYVFPDNFELTAWVSVAVGNAILFLFAIMQSCFKHVNKIKNPFVYFVLSRLYVYLLGCGCVMQWRGVWFLQDHYTGKTWQSATGSTVIGVSILCCLRCLGGIVASPLVLLRDNDRDNVFVITRRFTSKVVPGVKFGLDVCLTVFFINNLVVVFWRGTWSLLDLYLVPDSITVSGAYSFIISFSLAILILLGQHSVQRLSQYLHKRTFLLQILLEDMFLVFAGMQSVCHWRGAWLLQDGLLFPNNKVLSVWVSHTVGSVGLILLFSSRSYLTSGCCLDTIIHKMEGPIFDLRFWELKEDQIDKNTDSYNVVETKVDIQGSDCDSSPPVSPSECDTRL